MHCVFYFCVFILRFFIWIRYLKLLKVQEKHANYIEPSEPWWKSLNSYLYRLKINTSVHSAAILSTSSGIWGQSTVCAESTSAALACLTSGGAFTCSGHFCHTLSWPLSQDLDVWSQRPGLPVPEESDGSQGASRSLYPTPTWRWPLASCNKSTTSFYSLLDDTTY